MHTNIIKLSTPNPELETYSNDSASDKDGDECAAVESECSIVDETVRPSPMKMRTRSKAQGTLDVPESIMSSDTEENEPRPRQRTRHVQAEPPNFSAATRINSPVLPARHLHLVNRESATRDASDQVQECASEEADSNLTSTLNFFLRVTNFSSQSSAHAGEYRTSELRRGYHGWLQGSLS